VESFCVSPIRRHGAQDGVVVGFVSPHSPVRAKVSPRLAKMGVDEEGMGWHSFKRFRKMWLRGARCLEDLNNFWMAHKPQTMSEVYSHLYEEVQLRLDEAKRVGYGFVLPGSNHVSVVPIVPKVHQDSAVEIAA